MAYIEVSHVSKTYGKKEKVEALHDVNFTIEKGEFVAITGASGSGKTTLLNLLGGNDIGEGSILVDGVDVAKGKDAQMSVYRRRKVGFVFQEYNLIPVLTVEENIEMPVRLDGKRMDEDYKEELLQMLGLTDRRYHLPEELSGGQKQRVAIGRALANHPALLLADEPTGNLDRKNGMEIMTLLLQSAKNYAQTLILVTHDPGIAAMADRIISLSDGKVVSDVTVKHAISSEISESGEVEPQKTEKRGEGNHTEPERKERSREKQGMDDQASENRGTEKRGEA